MKASMRLSMIHGLGDVVVARELGPLSFEPIDEVVDQRGDVVVL